MNSPIGLLLVALLLAATSCCPAPAARPVSPHPPAHPLLGRIWDVGGGRAIEKRALVARLAAADVVLLGETHDNPRHHAWQAELLHGLIAGGRRPRVAFEMIESDEQGAVDAARRSHPRDPELLAHAVGWAQSGWPDFRLYRPVFAAALDADLPVVAANLPMADVRALARQGLAGMDAARASSLGLDRPLAPDAQAAVQAEMAESHCGMLPPEMLGGMVLAQRARDAQMAEAIRTAAGAGPGGAVAILGAGHARTDRGVPARLRELDPSLTIVAVALLEVDPAVTDPARYAAIFGAPRLPFDVVIFTAPEPREDPCAAMAEQHARHRPR